MGAQILVMYKPPKDAAAFDDYYDRIHTPLAKKPGTSKLSGSAGLW